MSKSDCTEVPARRIETSPAKTACIYISSVVLVITVLSSLSLLRFIISICHYEYTTGRTVCSPQNVVLDKLPVEIPSRTLFLRVGGSEYCDSVELFNASKHEHHDEWEKGSSIEHSLALLEGSNFSRFKNLRELTLFRCGVGDIKEFTFANLTKLKKLSLRSNRLYWIRETAFSGLSNLTALDLSNNPLLTLDNLIFTGSNIVTITLNGVSDLSMIDNDVFHNATVEILTIGGASLTVLSRKSLAPLKQCLKSLTLVDNAKKLSIDEKAFENFHLLKSLNLTNSSLSQVQFLGFSNVDSIILDYNPFENGTFQFTDERDLNTRHLSISRANLSEVPEAVSKLYKRLNMLTLSGNNIRSIRAENFCDLNELAGVDLSDNKISSINENIIEQLPQITHLRLHSNLLSALPQVLEDFFTRLKAVTISGNPLHCNCDLKWFADWLKMLNSSEEYQRDLNRANCSVPLEVNLLEAGNSVFLCHTPKIEKHFFTEPVGEDVVVLKCSISGDPPPKVTWQQDDSDLKVDKFLVDEAIPEIKKKENNRTIDVNTTHEIVHSHTSGLYFSYSTLSISFPGNYTCIGKNSMGAISHTFDTNLMPITKKRFKLEDPKKLEFLASLEGAAITAILLLLIGFLIKRES